MKILIIGAGGIGSYLAQTINNLMTAEQIPDDVVFEIWDPDMVEEKNIKYQRFDMPHIGMDKVEAIEDQFYGVFTSKCRRLKSENLADVAPKGSLIISAVDNAQTRRDVFNFWATNADRSFIDLRSEGRTISYFTPGPTPDGGWTTKLRKQRAKVLVDGLKNASEEDGSCQLAFELAEGIIQLGNQIVAPIGAQLMLNHLRGIDNPAFFITRV